MNLNIFSEIAPLKNVIIHSPIGEHQYLKLINTKELLGHSENPDFLLFDEVVDSNVLIKEHQKLQSVLDRFENNTTNNIMELTAVIEALKSLNRACDIIITTDSNYVKNGITEWMIKWKKNGWKNSKKKPIKNKDLWLKLDKLCEKHITA